MMSFFNQFYFVRNERADVAQSVERILGKDEVAGSNPAISSIKQKRKFLLFSLTLKRRLEQRFGDFPAYTDTTQIGDSI